MATLSPASTPFADTPADAERAAGLRSMKRNATGLLLLATATFVLLRIGTDGDGWTGYAEAFAEAAMVGGIADWFAVTALFRHPLGLPIPHTAIIPKRKDQIGRSLGEFVQENFLEGDLVTERVRDFGVAERLGHWMSEPANAARLGEQTSAVISGASGVLSDEDVASGLEQAIVGRLRKVPFTPLVGRGLDIAVEGGHHQAALDAGLKGLDQMLTDQRPTLRARLSAESPWWVPDVIDDRVFEKLMTGVQNLVVEVRSDPDHPLRGHIEERTQDLALRLKDSPELRQRGEELKEELLAHPEVRAWFASLWSHIKVALLDAADDPESELRTRLETAIVDAGRKLTADPALQAKVDGWIESLVRYAVDQSKGEVADLIASTVERWDADATGRRIEVQVGRDLQFIRINGTVVGGIAGLVIHAVGQLL